jgi:hypothetical protein
MDGNNTFVCHECGEEYPMIHFWKKSQDEIYCIPCAKKQWVIEEIENSILEEIENSL